MRQYQITFDVDELAEKIEAAFIRYRVRISITDWVNRKDRVIYKVKLKGDTREVQFFARLSDVQLKLRLPFFRAFVQDFNIYLIVSDKEVVYDHLPGIITMEKYAERWKSMQLPYVLGYNVVGNVMTVDLGSFPHLLLGGASNSGKSVGLQALFVSIMYFKSPRNVNFILIDVGANDLIPFDGLPHLSCPVVRDREVACETLLSLKTEMERRITLQAEAGGQLKNLPRLVLGIDEFPALFAETGDRNMLKGMVNAISSLLQRGRHAKIHVVLAAQNPTFQNMKIDLGNFTGRIAFKCAKKNFSETILGEGGAENLYGKGDMLLKCTQLNGTQRIQGIFISPSELQQMILNIRFKWESAYFINHVKFIIDNSKSDLINTEVTENQSVNPLAQKRKNVHGKFFAEVILWVLRQDEISCNMLMKEFSMGWNRASQLIGKLYDLGIVGDLDAKLPRKVLPQSVEDLSSETIYCLEQHGFDMEHIKSALSNEKDCILSVSK